MCQPASFIETKSKVFWSKFSDSHEDIIQEHKLHEGARINFVRIEITPPDMDFTKPISKWIYNVDQDITPDWFNKKTSEEKCRKP